MHIFSKYDRGNNEVRKAEAETIIFNTAIKTKGELLNNFEIDIKSSWLSKFL